MKTKLRFLWVLLALLVGGVNGAWADLNFQIIANDLGDLATRTAIANGITSNDGNIKITFISGGSGSEVSWQSSDSKYEDKTKTYTPASIKFQPGSSFKVEGLNGTKIKQVFLYGIYNERPFSVGETELTSYADDPNWWVRYWAPTEAFDEVTISNPSSSNNAYIYDIRVEYKLAPTLMFVNGGTGTLKIGAGDNNGNYSCGLIKSDDVTIAYSLPSTNTAGATINASNGTVTASTAGTVVVRATSSETDTYYSSYADYTLTVLKGSSTYSTPNDYQQSYPHTWDFTTSSTAWSATQTEVVSTYGDWNGTDTYFHPTDNISSITEPFPRGYNVTAIKGLRFSQCYLGLDWGFGHIYMGAGDIVIPGLAAGSTVTFVMEGRNEEQSTTLTAANTSGNDYEITRSGYKTYSYSITSSGNITFSFNHAVSIRSIAVTGAATYATTNVSGVPTFAFTGVGELAGGTKITDVPGIEMTIGASGDTWVVADQTKTGTYYSGLYASGSDREETFFLFEPLVNGFLTLQGTFFGGGNSSGNDYHLYLEEVDNTSNKLMDVNTRIYTEYTCAVPLLAGKTYKLYNGVFASQFHGFSFEPAFLTTDNSAKQTETYTAYPSLSTYPQIVTTATTGVTFASNNTEVATVASDGDGTPTYTGLGSTTITATVTKDALSRQASYTLEYQQEPLTLNFQNGTEAKTVDWSSASAPTFTNAITSTDASPEVLSSLTITYSSSNAAVATVDPSGVVTFLQSGIPVTITASSEAYGQYRASTASYQVTAVGTVTSTISMRNETAGQNVSNNGSVNITYPDHVTVVGTSSADLTVKYRSENIGIATVNETTGEVTPVSSGTVKIYAYTESNGQYAPVEVSYNLTVKAIGLNVRFLPASGTINVGKTITPYATFPSLYTEDLISITASSSNTGVATVVETLWDKDNPDYSHLKYSEETDGKHKILALYPTITGVSAGTAVISLTINSGQFQNQTPATYTVTVVDGEGLNFDWADNRKLYMYEGDYMMMPAITGNANGYPFVQNNAQRYVWAMKQDDNAVTLLSWYNTNYHPGEGEPFYWLEDNIDDENDKLAYILYAASTQSRTEEHPEGLMIYARKTGTVTIHAKDLQLDKELPSTIELEILPKSTIYGTGGELDVEASDISYPFTWDFTEDFSDETVDALDANSYYWTTNGDGVYRNGLGLQNSDYADDNHDGNNTGSQRLFKALLANHHTIPAFKGMQVQLQGTDYPSKFERIILKPKAGSGRPHLHITGGPQMFKLPAPGTGIQPDAYRVFIKALPTTEGRGEIKIHVGGTDGVGGTEYNYKNSEGQFNESGIYSAPVTSGQEIVIGAQDADVYWIAVSTEAKSITPAYGATVNAEMMATYSYKKAMDYGKSSEANEVDAYVASELNWNNTSRSLEVTLRKHNDRVPTPSNASVPNSLRTGVVLRAQKPASPTTWTFEDLVNDKDAINSNNSGTNFRSKITTNGLVVEANKNGWVRIDDEAPAVTIGSNTYAKCLDLVGKSNAGYRFIKFEVNGPTAIDIDCCSDAPATLEIYAGSYDGPNSSTNTPVSTISVGSSAATKTYHYSDASGTTIYICSATNTSVKIYSITKTTDALRAYMIADAENVEGYSEPAAPTNYLLATSNETPTLYSDAGSADGLTQSAASKPPYVPFIFSSRYTYTPTGAQEHDAGYFSFWRIYGTSITAGRNMAYLVLNTNEFGGAVGENGKASDVVQWISGGASRMGLRFVEEDGYTPTAVNNVAAGGVTESVQQGNDNLYDLRGVRVNRPTKGIYIYKGKKVLVK